MEETNAAEGAGAVTPRPMAVVFDMAGVVLRWRPLAVVRAVLPDRVGRGTDDGDAAAAHWVAQIFQDYGGDWGGFDRGLLTPAQLAARVAARTGLTAAEVLAVVAALPDELQPIAATAVLIRRLHAAGLPLYFLSNMPGPVADELQRRHPALFACFRDGVFSARVHLNKPERAIHDAAAARFGHPPRQLLFIDDHPPNVAAAQALGWQAFVCTDPAQMAAELQARGIDGAAPS